MTDSIRVKKPDIAPILEVTFSDYHGRKFRVVPTERVTFYDTNWGGGTRNYYIAVQLESGRVSIPNIPAPWNNPMEGATVDVPEDVVIVEHSIFCGQDTGITIYAHPSRLPKLLK